MNEDSVSGKRRYSRRRARTRAEILAAAQEVFALRGYHDASIAEIAEKAGVAVGTFYLYFRDKDEAFTTVLREGFSEVMQHATDALRQDPKGPTLDALIRVILQLAYERRALFRIVLTGEEAISSIYTAKNLLSQLILTTLEDIHRRQAVQGFDLSLLAHLITGLVIQSVMWWFENEVPEPDEMTDQVVRLLRFGLPPHVFSAQLRTEKP